jgi:hypothetical protein
MLEGVLVRSALQKRGRELSLVGLADLFDAEATIVEPAQIGCNELIELLGT